MTLRNVLTRRSYKHFRSKFRNKPVRLVILLLLPALILYITSPYWSELLKDKSLTLTDAEKSLVGNTTIDKKYIKESLESITFNRAEQIEGVSEDIQKVLQLAAQKEESTGERPYKVTFDKSDDRSISLSDDTDSRTIKLTPQFESFNVGLDADSRVVYSRGSQEKHVYTLKK